MKFPSTQSKTSEYDRLAVRYGLPLRRFFERRLKTWPEPEDLVQEVFVRLVRQGQLCEIHSLDGYVFQTAANVLHDYLRRWTVRTEEANSLPLDADTMEGGFSPERLVLGEEALTGLIVALQQLPEKTQVIFSLYHFESVAQVDIARRLNMPLSTVEKHMGRANQHLLAHFREER